MNQELSKIWKTKGTKKCKKKSSHSFAHTVRDTKRIKCSVLKWTSNRHIDDREGDRIESKQSRTEHNGTEWNGKERVGYVCLCLCHYLFCSWIRLPAMALCCHRHCRCRQLLLVVRCSSHPLTMPIVVVARINYFIVVRFFFLLLFCTRALLSFDACVSSSLCLCLGVCMCMCYRFVLICLVEATHAQNFYHSLQEWSWTPSYAHQNNNSQRSTPKTRMTHSSAPCTHTVNATHTCILRFLHMTSVPETFCPHSR